MNQEQENEKNQEFSMFPFIGSLEIGETFEYLLLNLYGDRVEIAIVNWLVNRTILNIGDKIDLYIPKLSTDDKRLVKLVNGTITSANENEEIHGVNYVITLNLDDSPAKALQNSLLNGFIENFPISTSLTELLIFFIKDSMILKEGVEIYLKHLIPFFSRIVNYSADEYVKLKDSILMDILHKVKKNQLNLKELHQMLRDQLKNDSDIPIYIQLEELRETLESEISTNLFEVIFSENDDSKIISHTHAQNNYSIAMYIDAIKILEKRIYANYNSIVILYLKALGSIQSEKGI